MASSSSKTGSAIAANTAGTLYFVQPICVHWCENLYRCYASVQWGWGILTVRPRKVRKGSCLQVENGVVPTFEAEEGCLETKRQTLDSAQEESVKEKAEVGTFGSHGPTRMNSEKEEKEMLEKEKQYREMLNLPKKLIIFEKEVVEKKMVFNRGFTRALTDKGGKLARRIRNNSQAQLRIIESRSREEMVMLRGPVKVVNKAEQMLQELLSSAMEISVSDEEQCALLKGGKEGCIMNEISRRISAPVHCRDGKLVIHGEKEEIMEAKHIVEEELRLLKKILSER